MIKFTINSLLVLLVWAIAFIASSNNMVISIKSGLLTAGGIVLFDMIYCTLLFSWDEMINFYYRQDSDPDKSFYQYRQQIIGGAIAFAIVFAVIAYLFFNNYKLVW